MHHGTGVSNLCHPRRLCTWVEDRKWGHSGMSYARCSWRSCPACCTCHTQLRAQQVPRASGAAARLGTSPRQRSTTASSPAASSCLRSSQRGTGWPAVSPLPVSLSPPAGMGGRGVGGCCPWGLRVIPSPGFAPAATSEEQLYDHLKPTLDEANFIVKHMREKNSYNEVGAMGTVGNGGDP